jgi:hypothetical protein
LKNAEKPHSISAKKFFSQAWKLFPRNLKMTEFHFSANVMLRQPRVRASRASPAEKSQGLRVVCPKNFSRATFFVFWGIHLVDRLFTRETNLEKKRSVLL